MHGTIDLAADPHQKAASDKAWSIPLDDIDVSQPELLPLDALPPCLRSCVLHDRTVCSWV